jgi:uncharacterized protein
MMEKVIGDLLRQLEIENEIKVLFAVDGGSRAAGLDNHESDYDVRFVYVKPVEWYLSLDKQVDTMEYFKPSIELVGWDLKKALQLLKKSNPSILEWIHSPIIYDDPFHFIKNFQSLAKSYFSSKAVLYHYFNMAKMNERLYLEQQSLSVKKLFYVLKPLLACAYTIHHQMMPPVMMSDLIKELEKGLQEEMERLICLKQSLVLTIEREAIPMVLKVIQDQFNVVDHYLMHLDEKSKDSKPDLLNPFFIQLLKLVWSNLPDINLL